MGDKPRSYGKSPFGCGLRKRLHRDDGTATVEFVIWLPVILLIFALIADVSLIFGGQAQALRVVQDANRALSIGRFQTIEATETFVLSQIGELSANATIEITVVDGVIFSVLTIPASDLMATGFYNSLVDIDLEIQTEFLSEA